MLEPLSVPARSWESISLNFISGLPKVGDLEAILVVIDCFSKYATFIPTHKYYPIDASRRKPTRAAITMKPPSKHRVEEILADKETKTLNYVTWERSNLTIQYLYVQISTGQGLLRVREFTLAEIDQQFVDPEDKSHPKYSEVVHLEFLMFPREEQISGQSTKKIRLGLFQRLGIINNETLAYFIGRVNLFLTHLSIDKDHLRFKQHLPNEMAHYAADCWDAEIYCWIECVGIADRSAYDLQLTRLDLGLCLHIIFLFLVKDKGGVPLVAAEKFSEPREVEALNEKEALEMKAALESKGEVEFYIYTPGKNVPIKKNMVSILKEKKKEHQRVFTLSVIEPSFGIGWMTYCLFEPSFYTSPSKAGNEQLNVFRLPPLVAPFKCTSIGKRYARTEELGVPLAITVDSTRDVTIRPRDNKLQFRFCVEEAASVVKSVTDGQITWEDVWQIFPISIVGQHMTES
ncbi:glycine--tRNA ligase, mitochondrial 1-like [Durio zibethinus]|uniref:Glycine--tRNA ligase, mitochondrial 1-like n=1 Tax=Durio zibethinus TaxID=66656 RepID=A0A6P6ABG2_DURZI|nr:glycine--tRNA ligase, mitochondrial 1-like [Durio zibethinus]